VLVVHGEADRMVPVQHGAWLAAAVPDARWSPVPGAGHITVLERAPEVLPALRAAARS
jgi:pimeloyl-ACP methyl ester carboxylesterase